MSAATQPSVFEAPVIPLVPGTVRSEPGILDRTVCITIQLGGIGNRKKVSTAMIEVPLAREEGADGTQPAVDKEMLGVSKQLLDSPELRAIRKLDGRIRSFVYDKCLPYKVGVFLLPVELVAMVEDKLKEFRTERETLVDLFIAAYPAQIEAAAARLLVLHNPADYKPPSTVRDAFTFDWQYVSFGTPGRLKDISPEFFRQEQAKAATKWAEASEAIQQVLRAQMRELVNKLSDKLNPGADGKPKTVRKEGVDNLRDFLETFDVRNVTSDGDLAALVARAKTLLGNASAEDMRGDDRLRSDLAAGFKAINEELRDIVVEGPRRHIQFED
jgi:Protein of unknown function (DUF3150)